MAVFKVEDYRNIALVGHSGAGKTTLAEACLFKAGLGLKSFCLPRKGIGPLGSAAARGRTLAKSDSRRSCAP